MSGKDMRQLARRLRKQGWTVVTTGGGHQLATSPDGTQIRMSGSPSCSRAVANAKAMLRRAGAKV